MDDIQKRAAARERFIQEVRAASDRYFSTNRHDITSSELEAATLCLVLEAMKTEPHHGAVLRAVARYARRVEQGVAHAITGLLAELADVSLLRGGLLDDHQN